jgi:Ni/Fe-hydrogenase 1 B-type cytochrome subunit
MPRPAQVTRAPVWSPMLRAVHWGMTLALVVLLASGWALRACALEVAARPVHLAAGQALTLLLLLRIYLLFLGRGTDHWRDCVPGRERWGAVAAMLRFYLSLGRMSLPPYFGHNPLWGPLYLVLYVVLCVQAVSGFALQLATGPAAGPGWIDSPMLPALHGLGYAALALFSLLHVAAVFAHDWRGSNAEISAMVGGSKVFVVERRDLGPGDGIAAVRLEDLLSDAARKGRGGSELNR